MPASARGAKPSILLVAIAACSAKHPPRDDAAPVAVMVPANTEPEPGSGAGRITFSPSHKPAKTAALGKHCTITGEPLVASCVGGPEGLALDAAGTLWVVSGAQVRRFARAEGADCRDEPAGEPVALPPVPTRAQAIDKGPVYMRSGGAAWHLLSSADAIYAYDYLGGMFRIDCGKAEPTCTEAFGYDSAVAMGGKLLVSRQGIERLAPGKPCKASSAKIDDKAQGALHVLGGKLHVATRDNLLVRYDGAPVASEAKPCSIGAVTACGDGTCIVDGNCRKLLQLGPDGAVARTIDHDKLFDPVPWSIPDAITRPDGTVVLLARNRDGHGQDATCEGALYELSPALFAH